MLVSSKAPGARPLISGVRPNHHDHFVVNIFYCIRHFDGGRDASCPKTWLASARLLAVVHARWFTATLRILFLANGRRPYLGYNCEHALWRHNLRVHAAPFVVARYPGRGASDGNCLLGRYLASFGFWCLTIHSWGRATYFMAIPET